MKIVHLSFPVGSYLLYIRWNNEQSLKQVWIVILFPCWSETCRFYYQACIYNVHFLPGISCDLCMGKKMATCVGIQQSTQIYRLSWSAWKEESRRLYHDGAILALVLNVVTDALCLPSDIIQKSIVSPATGRHESP